MNKGKMRQIRASAGSGKTYELTRCYVEKLAQIPVHACSGAVARGILAITFTNAAANEMRQRVMERLKKAVLDKNDNLVDADKAARWLAIFIEDSSALNIRTIDSLLHQILRLSALDLAISPDYVTEFSTRDALMPYLDLILEQGMEDADIGAMIREACDALIAGAAKSKFVGEKIILDRLGSLFELALKDQLNNVVTSREIEGILAEAGRQFSAAAKALLAAANPDQHRWLKKALDSVNNYADGKFGDKLSAACIGEGPAKLFSAKASPPAGIERAYAEFLRVGQEYYRIKTLLDNAGIWSGCVRLAKRIAGEFRADMRKSGIFPQALVSRKAMQVLEPLGAVSDAFCRMGNSLSHFLVDEFQDTSDEQWAVLRVLALEALSRGGSLLWVGDPKQSIYGWRGGNSALFDAVGKDETLLAPAGKADVYFLETNWRSAPEIIAYNNKFFRPLASQAQAQTVLASMLAKNTEQKIIEEGAKRLSDVYGDVCQKQHKSEAGYVRVERLTGDNARELKEAAQQRVCEILQEVHRRRPWSDMLVLVRSGDFAKEAAIRMEAAGIPFITENGLLLKENCLILEIVAFLSFLNNTGDELAFWAVINGDIVKRQARELADVDLAALAADRGKAKLHQAFAEKFPELWQKIFAPFVWRRGILTPYDIVMEWQERMGVAENFPADVTMLRRFMETVHLAESNGTRSVAAFLEYWEEDGDKEKAPMPESMDAVRIMTIHKAKGLQAPVAILPDTCFNIKAPEKPMLFQIGKYTAVAQMRSSFGPLFQREMTQQALEALNLLYVAMTRPEAELYVLQTERQKATSNTTQNAVRLLAEGARDLAHERDAGMEANEAETPAKEARGKDESEVAATERTEAVFAANWAPMDWLPRLKIHRNHTRADHLTARERGTLIHAALEQLALDADFAQSVQIALLAAERSTGIAAPAESRAELLGTLTWLAELPESSEWLMHGFPEHSFLLPDGSMLRADLLVPQRDGGILVIDYKSGTPSDAHGGQMRSYLEALKSSGQFAGEPVGLLIYLDLRKFQKITLAEAGTVVSTLPLN